MRQREYLSCCAGIDFGVGIGIVFGIGIGIVFGIGIGFGIGCAFCFVCLITFHFA